MSKQSCQRFDFNASTLACRLYADAPYHKHLGIKNEEKMEWYSKPWFGAAGGSVTVRSLTLPLLPAFLVLGAFLTAVLRNRRRASPAAIGAARVTNGAFEAERTPEEQADIREMSRSMLEAPSAMRRQEDDVELPLLHAVI